MRKIKYRGRRVNDGQWVYGDLETRPTLEVAAIHQYDENGIYDCQDYVDKDTVSQFTGKLAGRRTEIYEGDIISVTDMMGDMAGGQTRRGIVKWDERRLAFVIDFDDPWDDHPVLFEEVDCDDFFFATVIGNIYENGSEQIKTEQRDSRPVKTLSDNG